MVTSAPASCTRNLTIPISPLWAAAATLAAASIRDIEIVKFLVQEAGADVNQQLTSGDYGRCCCENTAIVST
jgi:hypothetical protein